MNSLLAFPADVTIPTVATATVTPPNDLFTQIGGLITKADSTKIGSAGPNLNVIAAGSEADVSFPLATGATVNVTVGIDVEAYLTGILDVAISELSVMADHLGATARTDLAAITDAQCVNEIGQIGNVGTALTTAVLKGLTQVAVDCAGQVVDLGAFSALQGVFAVAAGLVAAVFETAFLGASIVVGGLSGPDATISTSKPTLTHECDTTGMAKAASSLFANYSGGQEAGYIYRVSCQGPYAAAFAGVEQTVGQHIDLDQLLFAEHNGTWTIASETNIVQ